MGQNEVSFTEYLIVKYSFDKHIMRIELFYVINKGILCSVLINVIGLITCVILTYQIYTDKLKEV